MTRTAFLVAALALAGCGGLQGPAPIASADCKVYRMEAGRLGPTRSIQSDLERKEAVADLGTSDFRRNHANQALGSTGTVERAMRDCNL